MGLFRKSEIERIEEEARANPSPATYTTLAERLLAGGDLERALDVARRGADRFPDSDRSRATYQFIRRQRMQVQIGELQRRIAQNPGPSDFEVLANIHYRELKAHDKALDLIRQGLEKFPQSEGLHFLDGQIRFDRFHEEFIARDGDRCLFHLGEAVRLNPQNYKAWMQLARLNGELGLYDQARACVATLRRIAPDDEVVRALEKVLAQRPSAFADADEALRDAETRTGLSPDGQAIAAVFGAPAAPLRDRMALTAAAAQGLVRDMLGHPWALGAFVFGTDWQPIAQAVKPDLDGAAWQQTLITLHRASEDASRRLDIGSFVFGTLDCPTRRVHIRERGAAVLAVVVKANSRPEEIDAELEHAAEKT